MEKEEQIKNFYKILDIDKEHDIIIYDPYIINTQDLKDAGIKNLVRIRRPYWGQGDVSDFIKKIGFNEFIDHLDKEITNDTRRDIRNKEDKQPG